MDKIGTAIAAYASQIRSLLGRIWETPIGEAIEEDGSIFFRVAGGIVGAITGLIGYLAMASKQGYEVYPIFVIVSLAAGASVGVGAGRLAYGVVLFVFRMVVSGIILIAPPVLVILILRLLATAVKFLFTPL